MNAPLWRPVWRSRKVGHLHLKARWIILVALITLLGPAILGLIILSMTAPFISGNPTEGVLGYMAGLGGLMTFSPIIGIVAVPLGLLAGAMAMRVGWAGWGVAVAAAVIVPLVFGALFQLTEPTTSSVASMMVLLPVVVFHAIVMWISARLLMPDAFLLPDPSQ